MSTRKLSSPGARFYAFVVFFVLVFFTGGGSRDDIQSLLILRPLAVFFCAYALTVKTPELWTGRMFPLYIVGALSALMVVQLIPLPPPIWVELPGRQIFADIADIAGIAQPSRPLSLSPSKTLNSLFSLAVPIAAMMLYLNLDREYRRRAVPVIIILCSLSALFAIFQVIGPSRGPLYIYRITNFGAGVGLFANRNHQAVLLASTIVMIGWYAGSLAPNVRQAALKFYASVATILVFVPLIFITGSRAGLLLMVPGLILALFMTYFGKQYTAGTLKGRSYKSSKSTLFADRRLLLTISILTVLGIAASSILLSRSMAYDRLFDGNVAEELRIQLLPTLLTMTKEYMPWGSGFGSFEHVYNIYEPQELLNPTYLNQAHNDWLQFLIEGGVPALLLLICVFVWFAKRSWIVIKSWRNSNSAKYRVLMCIAVMSFMLAASIGDYPLRVPSIAAVFAVLICTFNDSVASIQRRSIDRH
ncbi:O-antigen ligase family protein [Parasphingorhabdus sp.]|uniref:O-antigen ligase family protein n=1 Tax=Parasphingorhabdus sp. TaxID=2709688 RepID=UPI003267FD0F